MKQRHFNRPGKKSLAEMKFKREEKEIIHFIHFPQEREAGEENGRE